jgi:hypothetical protein
VNPTVIDSSQANTSTTAVQPPVTGLRALRYMPRAGWIVAGGICVTGAVLVGVIESGVAETTPIRGLFAALIAVLAARAVFRRIRGGDAGAWARGKVFSQIQQYGGGTYGTIAASVWFYLEAQEMWRSWTTASGVGEFIRGVTWDAFIGFSGSSIQHAIAAGTWPLYVIRHYGVLPAVAACWAAWAIDGVVKRVLASRRPVADAATNPDLPAASV